MRRFATLVLAFGLASLATAPARAQRPGGPGGSGPTAGGPGFALAMLRNPGVLSELKVSDDQKAKLETLVGEVSAAMGEEGVRFMNLEDSERVPAMLQANHDLYARVDKELEGILSPAQVRRFHEIQLQHAEVQGFNMPYVQDGLKLTADQHARMRAINITAMQQFRKLFEDMRGGRAASTQRLDDIQKDATVQALKALTEEQRAKYKELMGKPFEYRFGLPLG